MIGSSLTVHACLITKLCPTLCDPMDCSPLGSSLHGISQARILERIAISFSTGSSHPGIEPTSLALAGGFFTTEPPGLLIQLFCLFSTSSHEGFPDGSVVESTCQCRRCGGCRFNPCVREIAWRRKWQPTPVLLPEKSHKQRSLEYYSSWGCEESDTTKQLNMKTLP